jgi:NAD(P)H-flavin reductase
MVPLPYRVVDRRRELDDTVTLTARPVASRGIDPLVPGQFNMVYVFGVGEAPISSSGEVSDDGTVVHTVRAVGRVSEAICSLRPGDAFGVRGPFGNPWPLDAMRGKDMVVVAGGIGLAPLRPAIADQLRRADEHGRISILIGARQPDQLLFTAQHDAWRAAGADVLVTVDAAGPHWPGSIGVVTDLVARARFDPANTVALVCGPEIMMRFAAQRLVAADVPGGAVYVSMERNMKCGVGLCGHCQYGPDFVCRDGPVFPFSVVQTRFFTSEI